MSQPSWRRSRGRAGRYRGSHYEGRPDLVASPPPAVGEVIETIETSDIKTEYKKSWGHAKITGVRSMASYNWLGEGATITIPGKPPLWTPPNETRQLPEDDGVYYRDRNAASHPSHPLEPAVVSVMKMNDIPCHVNLFACGSTIGNLLRFVRDEDRGFRMLVEVVGETIHFVRRENTPKEQILGVRGYGHTFPEAYTTWEPDVRRSSSHQRILKYQFGGLDMMLRFEGDGYIKSDDSPKQAESRNPSSGGDLLSRLQELHVQRDQTALESPGASDRLQVLKAGEIVPQDAIFDLKTRSIKRREDDILGEQLPRLWIAQVPTLILAYHDKGVFRDVRVNDVRTQVKDWESQNQEVLERLVSLLRQIIAIAHSDSDGKLEIVRQDGGKLEIRKRAPGVGAAFSQEVRQDWATWLEAGADTLEFDQCQSSEDDVSGASAYLDDSGDDGEQDFTACAAACGYCGKCS